MLFNRRKPQQEQQTKDQDEYESDYPMDNYGEDYLDTEPDNSRYEIEYDDVLNDFMHSLRSEVRNTKGIWERPNMVNPKMNDVGVFDFLSDLRIIMHKGTILSNISQDYANLQTNKLAKAFSKKLVFNTEKYNVDKNQRKILVLEFANQIFMALSRPIGDKERQHRSKKMQFKEDYKHNEVRADEIRL